MKSVWDLLEIPPGSDRDTIRRAYAKKLRVTQPEDDPEGFKRLREAYEAALDQHDYAVRWAEFDDHEESWPGEVAAEPAALDWGAAPKPVTMAEPTDAGVEPEIDAMLAAREEELAALRAAMDGLDTALRGPWRPADAVLEERLKDILRSPAMGEIRVRDDVEPWLADLLASTIPHSDAVLLQSIEAFGWGRDGQYGRGVSWSVSVVLGRLDEWRIIEGLNHHSHAYHAAWRSLTRPPGAWWSWRIAAFRPNVIGGVETLLGEHGDVAPGLHHSFKAESVERWKRFLAKPRLTLGMLAMIPIVFLATLWLGYAVAGSGVVGQAWVIGGTAAIGFATPLIILFTLSRWRLRWQARPAPPRWQREGWLAAYAALALIAMLLPRPSWPALIALPAILVAAWAYVAAPRTEPGPLALGRSVTMVAVAVFFSFAALDQLTPAETFAIGTMAALLVYLRLAAWPATRVAIENLLWQHREWIILAGVVAGLAAAGGIWWLRSLWQPTPIFYPVALAAIMLAPLVGAPHRGPGPSRVIASTLLLLAFFSALGASLPSNAPGGAAGSAAEADMARMETEIPGFSQVRRGNPALFDAIGAVMVRYRSGGITRDRANGDIAGLVNAAFRERLPDAQTRLLVEWLGTRLDRLKALRKTAPALCASAEAPLDDDSVPEPIRQRARAQIYEIAASPPASPEELRAGRPITGAMLARRASAALGVDPKTLFDRLDGKRGDMAACDARIAFTQAMLDSDRGDDIAATLRQELGRTRDAKPAPSRGKAQPALTRS